MTRFYHGGPLHLTRVLPATETGVPNCIDKCVQYLDPTDRLSLTRLYSALWCYRPGRVYVTTSLTVARLYATGCVDSGYAAVYEVLPDGSAKPDMFQESFHCASAKVVGLHSILPEKDFEKYRRAIMRSAYREVSYPNPSPEMIKRKNVNLEYAISRHPEFRKMMEAVA